MFLRANQIPILIVTFCLLWSSAFAAAKAALIDCPPLLLVTARCLLAGGLTLAIAAARPGAWRVSRRDFGVLILLGLANNALYLGLNNLAMQSVAAGVAALIASANPVLTAVLATVVLGERMTWRKAIGLGLGVVGVAIIVQHRIAIGADAPVGIAIAVAALVALVTGTILFKRLRPGSGLWIGNGIQNLVAGLAVAPFAFAFESVSDVVPTWRLLWGGGVLVPVRLYSCVCDLVPPPHGHRAECCQRLSFLDAATGCPLWMGVARGARGTQRPNRHNPDYHWRLFGHAETDTRRREGRHHDWCSDGQMSR